MSPRTCRIVCHHRREARVGAVLVLASAALTGGLGPGLSPPPAAGGRSSHPTNIDLVRQVGAAAIDTLFADFQASGKRLRLRIAPYHETAWLVEDMAASLLRGRGYEVVTVPATAPAAPAGGAPAAATPPPEGQPSGAAAAAAALQAMQGGTGAADSTLAAGADSVGAAPADAGSEADKTAAEAAGTAPPPSGSGLEPALAEIPVDAEIDLRVIELGIRYTGTHRSGFIFGDTKVERYAVASMQASLRELENPVQRWSGYGESAVLDEVPKDDLAILEGQRYPFTAPALPQKGGNRWVEPIIVSAIVVGLVFLFVSNRS